MPIFADGSRGKIVVVDVRVPIEIDPTSETISSEAEKEQVFWLLNLAEREEYVADALMCAPLELADPFWIRAL